MGFLRRIVDAVTEWFDRLSRGWAVLIMAVVTVGAVGAGTFSYQMYNYVQHDNEFCVSCHLMAEPSTLFGASAHRGLGCKACHQPTLIDRSTMALAQIIENPDSLTVHAEVPNERCVSCHVEGNAEDWILIEQSAGHRVHFESDEEVLQGLRCIECHSTSIHDFTPSEQTCTTSGCHSDLEVILGSMANIEIACGACHSFSAVVGTELGLGDGGSAARDALAPDSETCLSCHAMRTLMQLPEDDPHEGMCASCHKPHTQTVTTEAEQTCTTSGCHDDPMANTPFHKGLAPGVTEGCLTCHDAHTFQADGNACLSCHEDIFDDGGQLKLDDLPSQPPRISGDAETPSEADSPEDPTTPTGEESPGGENVPLAFMPSLAGLIHATLDPTPIAAAWMEAQERSDSVVFAHRQHRNVDCLSCHTADGGGHGSLRITGISDCRDCHHSNPPPVSGGCMACHEGATGPAGTFTLTRELTRTVGAARTAELPFDHERHFGEACSTCHTEGPTMSAEAVDCTSCHEPHHEVGSSCRACHTPTPARVHPVEIVHTGCAGAGCHTDLPFGGGVPGDREFCLTCHQGEANHQTAQPNCTECHRLPPPGAHAFKSAGASP